MTVQPTTLCASLLSGSAASAGLRVSARLNNNVLPEQPGEQTRRWQSLSKPGSGYRPSDDFVTGSRHGEGISQGGEEPAGTVRRKKAIDHGE